MKYRVSEGAVFETTNGRNSPRVPFNPAAPAPKGWLRGGLCDLDMATVSLSFREGLSEGSTTLRQPKGFPWLTSNPLAGR